MPLQCLSLQQHTAITETYVPTKKYAGKYQHITDDNTLARNSVGNETVITLPFGPGMAWLANFVSWLEQHKIFSLRDEHELVVYRFSCKEKTTWLKKCPDEATEQLRRLLQTF